MNRMKSTVTFLTDKNFQARLLSRLHFLTIKLRLRFFPSTKPPVIIVSQGRSGSTILMDVLNKNNDFLTIFEPFEHKNNAENSGLIVGRYMPPKMDYPEFSELFEKYLRGDYLNRWKNKNNKSRFHGNRILIKDIFILLLTPWMITRYPGLKVVVLMRNPIDTINSAIKANFYNHEHLKESFFRLNPNPDFTPAHCLESYRNEENPKLIVLYSWCIEYYVILNTDYPQVKPYFLIKYEDLVANNPVEINALFRYIDVDVNKGLTIEQVLKRESITAHLSKNDIQVPWTDAELCRAQEILEMFGLHKYYTR